MKNILCFFVMLIFSVVFGCMNVSALNDSDLITCDMSEEYLEWLELSDEEKSLVLMPSMCDMDSLVSKHTKKNIRTQFNLLRSDVPDKWDIRDTSYKAQIRNQYPTGMCWAFASSTVLEIYARKHFNYEEVYSATHMEYATTRVFADGSINEWGFNRTLNSGGNSLFSSAYFVNHIGPVKEELMKFEDYSELPKVELSTINLKKSEIDVNNVSLNGDFQNNPCSTSTIIDIKNKVMEFGAVESTMYMNSDSEYYRLDTFAYYYDGVKNSNHSVTIVGWDDDYAISKFSQSLQPGKKGAWIVQNSYGTEFGDDGYFYVSYDDVRICSYYTAIEDVDVEVEDKSYMHDKLGPNTAFGYPDAQGGVEPFAYGISVYEKEETDEMLTEITIGTLGPVSYKLYYYAGDGSRHEISDMTLIGEGKVDYHGYYTHKLETPLLIDSTVKKFSIGIYVESEYGSYPLSGQSSQISDFMYAESKPGWSYSSSNGVYWHDLSSQNLVLSLKAFTNLVSYKLLVEDNKLVRGTEDNIILNMNLNAPYIKQDQLTFKIFNSNEEQIEDYDVSWEDAESLINLNFYNSLPNGLYKINFYYKEEIVGTFDFIVNFSLTSDAYLVDDSRREIYISGPTELDKFLSNINGNLGTVNKSGVELDNGYVGTGMEIDGYRIVLNGDVTGDGLIKVNDVMKISKYTVEGTGLEDSWLQHAADVTGDGLIKVNDVMKISKYTVEGGSL